MIFIFLLLLLSQTSFGSKKLHIIDLDNESDKSTAAETFPEMNEKKILKPQNGMPSRAEDFNPDVNLLIDEKFVKTLDCTPSAVILKEEQQWSDKQMERKQTMDELTKSYLSKDDNVKHRMLRRRKEEQQKSDELKACVLKGVKHSRKRKRNELEEEFNDGKITKLELKTVQVFGGCLLFSNVGEKIRATHWKNEYRVHPLKCNSSDCEFEKAKQALKKYVDSRKKNFSKNRWIPASFGGVGEKYDTEKKAQESRKTRGKSEIKRKDAFAEEIDTRQQEDNHQSVIPDKREALAKTGTENESLFQEILRKYDKDVASEENQPKNHKYFTSEELFLKAKALKRKHSDENHGNQVKHQMKEKNRSSNILNKLDSSDEFGLNEDEYKEFDLNEDDSDLSLNPYDNRYHDQEREARDREFARNLHEKEKTNALRNYRTEKSSPNEYFGQVYESEETDGAEEIPRMHDKDVANEENQSKSHKYFPAKELFLKAKALKRKHSDENQMKHREKSRNKNILNKLDSSDSDFSLHPHDNRNHYQGREARDQELARKYAHGKYATRNDRTEESSPNECYGQVYESEETDGAEKIRGTKTHERNNYYFIELSNHYAQTYLWRVRNETKKESLRIMLKNEFGAFALQREIDFDSLEIDNAVIACEKDKDRCRDSNVDLTRIVEKGDDNITVRVLYGEHKGKQQKFSKNEVNNRIMKVKYYLSTEQEKYINEKTEKLVPKQIKRLSELQTEIEELLFQLCYNAYDSKYCTAMMKKWRNAQAYRYNRHDFENSNPFWKEAKVRTQKWEYEIQNFSEKIRSKLRKINPLQLCKPKEGKEIQMLLLKMMWLEIKAQSFGEKFREFVTDKTREAFKSRGKNPSDEKVRVRNVYYMCTQKEKIQKLFNDVKNAYEGGTEMGYAKIPLSASFGSVRVDSMIRTVALSEAKRLQKKIKDYMERLEREKKSDREAKPSTFVKGDGAFATARLEKYDVLRIWDEDLYDNVFDGPKQQHSESIFDPNLFQGVLNQMHYTWERKRYNLGWVRFHHEGIPYLAEVALDTIEAGKELFTCYARKHVISTDMKYSDDRKEIVRNVENKVKEMLQKIDRSNAK